MTTTDNAHALLVVGPKRPARQHTVAYNYRVLAPWQVADPNGNRSQVAFNVLGFVVASVVLGQDRRQRWRHARRSDEHVRVQPRSGPDCAGATDVRGDDHRQVGADAGRVGPQYAACATPTAWEPVWSDSR